VYFKRLGKSLSEKMPKEIVLNTAYGGFSPSDEVKRLYLEATKHIPRGKNWYFSTDVARDDPALIQAIRTVGLENAGGPFTKLKIIEIPDDVLEWDIMDYDGVEWVAERHRTWS
jgi:hypothetical protein